MKFNPDLDLATMWRIFFSEITDDKYRDYIIIKFWMFSACRMIIALHKDWSTLKPCNLVISGDDFVGLSAYCSVGLPQRIKCKFSNLHHSEFLR